MPADSVARPDWYSHGWNRDRSTHIVLAGEQGADLERYLRREGERLRFVTRRHATSTLGLLAALRHNEAVAMQGDPPNFFDLWSPPHAAA